MKIWIYPKNTLLNQEYFDFKLKLGNKIEKLLKVIL